MVIKRGQVYQAKRDVPVTIGIMYRGPLSEGMQKFLPVGTKVVVKNTPPADAKAVWVLPLNYGELEVHFVPADRITSPDYERYTVNISIDTLERYFVWKAKENIVFDDSRAKEYWELLMKKTDE